MAEVESTGRQLSRRVTPEVIDLSGADFDGRVADAVEGTVTLMWCADDSSLLDEYESALEAGEYERALRIHERLLDETETERDAPSNADDRTTVSYQERVLATDLSLDEADPVGFAVLPYHGGDLDSAAFEIEERLGSECDGYEYRLIVTPPSMSDGELEATETVGADVDEPALGVEEPEMAVLAAAVAAAVLAYAAAATGGTAPVETPEVGSDDGIGASVDELIEARADASE